MTDPVRQLPPASRALLKAASAPRWISPMLATLTQTRFSNPDWIFERKFDGQRVLAFVSGRRVQLMSRNRKDLNQTYPELAEALRKQLPQSFAVDGEVVAFSGSQTSFMKLQERMQIRSQEASQSKVRVFFYLFDLLYLDRYDTSALPLLERKELLRGALSFDAPIRFTAHRQKHGERYFAEACARGWEGLLAKRADSPYVSGRSPNWLKFKCSQGQELVIGGFTEPRGSAKGFGALLVGYYQDGRLRYAGKVGTGFSVSTRLKLRERMNRMRRRERPFLDEVGERHATWIAPRLMGEFAFSEWTRDGKLRHPSFRGLRYDKRPREIVRERASV
jgi:bifunctional non-homologous end joining protein LigD